MGLLDRLRRRDPCSRFEDMVRDAVGDRGYVYDDNEPGITVFDYQGMGMALDVTEHPYISVLFCDDSTCQERYGIALSELIERAPEDMQLETAESEDGSVSLMSSRPLDDAEFADADGLRAVLEGFCAVDSRIRRLADD